MSWVSHDLEPYVIQRHIGIKISFLALAIGSYAPDLATKWFAYGTFGVKAHNPAQFHRGWPGAGFTHSLTFGLAVAVVIYAVSRSRGWALGFLIGQWAHALTDTLDTVGTMLFFPWTKLFSVGLQRYSVHTGRFEDAASYFSGLGFVWDAFWLLLVVVNWRVLTRQYFLDSIVPADRLWSRLGRVFPEAALLGLYRACFFYGAARLAGWLFWAHVIHDYPFDLSWGGPH